MRKVAYYSKNVSITGGPSLPLYNGEGGLDAGQVEKRGCEEEKQDARFPCERQYVFNIWWSNHGDELVLHREQDEWVVHRAI